jgi:hypothetical protein
MSELLVIFRYSQHDIVVKLYYWEVIVTQTTPKAALLIVTMYY